MKWISIIAMFCLCSPAYSLPESYDELLEFVQEAPDQGDTGTCLYIASTGAMELIANKKENLRNPRPGDKYDLSESFLIHAPNSSSTGKYFWETHVLKFNNGHGIHISDWPFQAWNGTEVSNQPWRSIAWSELPRVSLPKIQTIPLFVFGNRWSTNVLKENHIQTIKEALVKYKSPVMVNYNDTGYWHVVLIVGYDDNLPGRCHELSSKECGQKKGAFFVRDSFGVPVELRDYDWFRIKGNAAFVVKEKL